MTNKIKTKLSVADISQTELLVCIRGLWLKEEKEKELMEEIIWFCNNEMEWHWVRFI